MEIKEQPKWCTCAGAGSCMGCMIRATVKEQLGERGDEFLVSFIPSIVLDESAADYVKSTGTTFQRLAMDMKMGM
uniref:Uncharacterized protein n=1 Tax=viral metagenome TaxID=1070528 RepID=A0A6M3JHW2_9ZZZZ